MSASFKLNDTEIFSELNQTVTAKNINVAANDTTTPSMCKAWVNFNGNIDASSDTPANHLTTANNGIVAAYNVDYVLDHQQGQYSVFFTNDMNDANYSVQLSVKGDIDFDNGSGVARISFINSLSAGSVRVHTGYMAQATRDYQDFPIICVAVFR